MILLFEQDVRAHGGGRFRWKPSCDICRAWKGLLTWRVGWGIWTVSYYPSPGFREFIDDVRGGTTNWRDD